MSFVDLYKSGYTIGFDEGASLKHRAASWELPFKNPMILMPGFDRKSFERGYYHGYSVGTTRSHLKLRNKWEKRNGG